MNFAEKRNLIQSLVEKIVYSQEQLIYTLTTDATKLQQFVSENYVNQNADKMEYIIGDNSVTITEKVFLRKYVNTVYDRGKNGVLNVTDNNHLIFKAFATAWKYRELYMSAMAMWMTSYVTTTLHLASFIVIWILHI